MVNKLLFSCNVPGIRPLRGLKTGILFLVAAALAAGCGIGDIEDNISVSEYDSGPVILAISPEEGTAGDSVSIYGEAFSPDPDSNLAAFNGVPAEVSTASDTLLVAVVPDGATTGPVEVTAREQKAEGPVFTVLTAGAVRVFVSTGGPDPDPDGYTLTLDGTLGTASAINDTVQFNGVEEGMHTLELSGVEGNCSVGGGNPRSLNVVGGDTTDTAYSVTCSDIIKNQIVFQTDRDGNQEIYLMNTDGSGQVNLTGHSASDFHPAVSPDGTKIAFASDRDGNDEIYMMNADGSGVTQITFTTGLASSQPAWSPSGDQIAFTRFTAAQNFDVFVIDTSGAGETNLTVHSANDGQPDWSSDGMKIAFSSDRDGDFEIYLMNPDGSGITQLTANTHLDVSPAWSPDDSRIAFRSDALQSADIFLMNADGSNVTALNTNLAADDLPDWSPGGSQIIYQSDSSGDLEIWRIDVDGSNLTNLTTQATGDDEHPAWSPVQ